MIPLSSAIPLTFRPSPVTSPRDRGRIGLFPLTSVLGERETCRLSFGISSDYEKT
jgi:hypothetical protein